MNRFLLALLLLALFLLALLQLMQEPEAIEKQHAPPVWSSEELKTQEKTAIIQRVDSQAASVEIKLPVFSTIRVQTYSGGAVSGLLLIGRDDGETLHFTLSEQGASVLESQLSFATLRAFSPDHFLAVPHGGGFVRAEQTQEVVGDNGARGLVVTIPEPRRVALQILDHQQQPVVAASIVPFEFVALRNGEGLTTIRTDADGTAQFLAFYGERTFRVEIRAWGYGTKVVEVHAQTQELEVELDRIHALGVVHNRSMPFSYQSYGSSSIANFGGKRLEDWKPIAAEFEAAQNLQPFEYVSWLIEAESGEWKEPEPFTVVPILSEPTGFSTTATMRAFVDPEFTIWSFPNSFDWNGKEVPVKVSFGPASCFPAGYPERMGIPLTAKNGQERRVPNDIPPSMFSKPRAAAFHQGDGHYLMWIQPGAYEVEALDHRSDARMAQPRYLPDQVITFTADSEEVQILLQPDERYVGLKVLDSTGFAVDCRWLLLPHEFAESANSSLFLNYRQDVEYRFVRPGEWDLRGGNRGMLSLEAPALAANLTWPAPLSAGGIWSIRMHDSESLQNAFAWH